MTAVMLLAPAQAADTNAASASLRQTFAEASRAAKASDDLDPGYELLGVAEAAQKQNMTQIANQAAAAFADLVNRAAARAMKGENSEDTLGQLVDLRFLARSTGIALPQTALDNATARLFPLVSAAVQKKFDAAAEWSEKLEHADTLGDLQASATQVMNEGQAASVGAAFEIKIAQLETLAGQEQDAEARGQMLEALALSRKARDDGIIDAKANNINVVAAILQNSGGISTDGARIGSETDLRD